VVIFEYILQFKIELSCVHIAFTIVLVVGLDMHPIKLDADPVPKQYYIPLLHKDTHDPVVFV